MALDTLKRLVWFVILALAQVLVLGHTHLSHYATPLAYIWFVVIIPRGYPKWATLLWAFLLGLTVDIFTNTAGTACGAMTLIALLQPYLIERFSKEDDPEKMTPGAKYMGWMKFIFFTLIITFIYCVTFFALEQFSFFNLIHWLMCVGGSSVVTLLLLTAFETIRNNG